MRARPSLPIIDALALVVFAGFLWGALFLPNVILAIGGVSLLVVGFVYMLTTRGLP